MTQMVTGESPPGRLLPATRARSASGRLPMHPAHQVGERRRLAGGLVVAVLLALGRGRLREHAVGEVQDLVDRLRRERVGDLAERAEPRVDLLRLGADRLA